MNDKAKIDALRAALIEFMPYDSKGADKVRNLLALTADAALPPTSGEAVKDTPESMANSNARFAIDGAIQYGRENRNAPPSDDHWLYEYWSIGRQLATLGATGWDNVTPAPAAPVASQPELCVVEGSEGRPLCVGSCAESGICTWKAAPVADTGAVAVPLRLAADVLGALFWRDALNPEGYEAIKQEFAALMRNHSAAPATPAPTADSAADARDAARYRFVREVDWDVLKSVYWSHGVQAAESREQPLSGFDAAIDAAMSTNTGEGER